jgi:hypothetical protein
MASPLGLALFIENITFLFFERRSLDTEKLSDGATHL